MSNYLAVMEVAWLVRDVEDISDVTGAAVNEAGKRLNQKDKECVEVEVGATPCSACSGPSDSAFIAANTAPVGLLPEIKIFNADGEKHTSRIVRSKVSGALRDVPFDAIDIREFDSGEEQ